MWNQHTIRPSRNGNSPSGRPEQMYYFPSLWGAQDQLFPVLDLDDINDCSEEAEFRSTVPCDPVIYDMCVNIMSRDNLEPATTITEATDLYLYLRQRLR